MRAPGTSALQGREHVRARPRRRREHPSEELARGHKAMFEAAMAHVPMGQKQTARNHALAVAMGEIHSDPPESPRFGSKGRESV